MIDWWIFRVGGVMLAVMIAVSPLCCSAPLRLDPQRQELQRQQDQCLARGGSPRECRP